MGRTKSVRQDVPDRAVPLPPGEQGRGHRTEASFVGEVADNASSTASATASAPHGRSQSTWTKNPDIERRVRSRTDPVHSSPRMEPKRSPSSASLQSKKSVSSWEEHKRLNRFSLHPTKNLGERRDAVIEKHLQSDVHTLKGIPKKASRETATQPNVTAAPAKARGQQQHSMMGKTQHSMMGKTQGGKKRQSEAKVDSPSMLETASDLLNFSIPEGEETEEDKMDSGVEGHDAGAAVPSTEAATAATRQADTTSNQSSLSLGAGSAATFSASGRRPTLTVTIDAVDSNGPPMSGLVTRVDSPSTVEGGGDSSISDSSTMNKNNIAVQSPGSHTDNDVLEDVATRLQRLLSSPSSMHGSQSPNSQRSLSPSLSPNHVRSRRGSVSHSPLSLSGGSPRMSPLSLTPQKSPSASPRQRRISEVLEGHLDAASSFGSVSSAGSGPAGRRHSTFLDIGRKGSVASRKASVFAPVDIENLQPESKQLWGNSLCLFGPHNKFRKVVNRITFQPVTDGIIFFCIIVNIIILAIVSPAYEEQNPDFAAVAEVLDTVVSIIFTVEMVMKVISLGFAFHHQAYLRDPWNRLDFFVVLTSWMKYVTITSSTAQFSAIRAFRALRALRPLRALKFLKGTRELISSLGQSWTLVLNVVYICAFFFVIYGILGQQLYSGQMGLRCTTVVNDEVVVMSEDICGSCLEGEVCQYVENPNYGITGFDNIMMALLTIFQCVSLEAWVDVMYGLMDAGNVSSWFYFITLIIFINYLTLNLFVAVISEGYLRVKNSSAEQELEELDRKAKRDEMFLEQSNRTASSGATPEPSVQGSSFRRMSMSSISRLGEVMTQTRHQIHERVKESKVSTAMATCVRLSGDVVRRKYFEPIIMFCIVVNTTLLATEYHGISSTHQDFLDGAEVLFAFIFIIELVLKVCFYNGLRPYLSDSVNRFDFIIVITSLPSLLLLGGGSTQSFVNISFLRVFRLLRIIRLLRRWESLRILTERIFGSLMDIGNIVGFLFFTLMVFTILGVQLFGTIDRANAHNRVHFDDFLHGFLALIQVLSGENWNEVLYEGMQINVVLGVLFFIIYVILTTHVLLNLFIAVILENFNPNDEEKEQKQRLRYLKNEEKKNRLRRHMSSKNLLQVEAEAKQRPSNAFDMILKRQIEAPLAEKWIQPTGFPTDSPKFVEDMRGHLGAASRKPSVPSFHMSVPKMRVRLARIVTHKYFSRTILAVILLSSLFLAIETPRTSDELKGVISVFDMVFMAIFTIEFILQVGAFGFIRPQGAYLKDPWNRLDFFVLVSTYVTFMIPDAPNNLGRVLRIGRTLRPLRMINRNEGLKVIINTIFKASRDIINVALLCLSFFIVYGILGISLFAGQFSRCSDESEFVTVKEDCVGNMVGEDGILRPRVWANPPYDFDNILNAFFTLFEVATLEGWLDVMWSGTDVAGVDKQPVRESHVEHTAFFISFVFIGSFFAVNLFVGVIINTFNELNGDALLTEEQLRWKNLKKAMFRVKPEVPRAPTRPWQERLYKVVGHAWFEKFFLGCIVVNMMLMLVEYRTQSDEMTRVLESLHVVFLILFGIEVVIRLAADGWRNWRGNGWNVFDALVVTVGLLGIVASNSGLPAQVFRALRVLRVVRIVEHARALRTLFNTMYLSLPAIINVSTLLLLLFFVFAVLGVQTFGSTKFGPYHNAHANFRDFPNAMLTLFRISTGEMWNGIMHDCQVSPPYCRNSADESNDCGNAVVSRLYFQFFYLACTFIMLNLFIAVILENFAECCNEEEAFISPKDINQFKKVWNQFDPDHHHSLPLYRVREFLDALGPPLGSSSDTGRVWMKQVLEEVRRNADGDDGNSIGFRTLLAVLAYNHVGLDCLEYGDRMSRASQVNALQVNVAATVIAANLKAFVDRKRFLKAKSSEDANNEDGGLGMTYPEEALRPTMEDNHKSKWLSSPALFTTRADESVEVDPNANASYGEVEEEEELLSSSSAVFNSPKWDLLGDKINRAIQQVESSPMMRPLNGTTASSINNNDDSIEGRTDDQSVGGGSVAEIPPSPSMMSVSEMQQRLLNSTLQSLRPRQRLKVYTDTDYWTVESHYSEHSVELVASPERKDHDGQSASSMDSNALYSALVEAARGVDGDEWSDVESGIAPVSLKNVNGGRRKEAPLSPLNGSGRRAHHSHRKSLGSVSSPHELSSTSRSTVSKRYIGARAVVRAEANDLSIELNLGEADDVSVDSSSSMHSSEEWQCEGSDYNGTASTLRTGANGYASSPSPSSYGGGERHSSGSGTQGWSDMSKKSYLSDPFSYSGNASRVGPAGGTSDGTSTSYHTPAQSILQSSLADSNGSPRFDTNGVSEPEGLAHELPPPTDIPSVHDFSSHDSPFSENAAPNATSQGSRKASARRLFVSNNAPTTPSARGGYDEEEDQADASSSGGESIGDDYNSGSDEGYLESAGNTSVELTVV